MVRPAHITPAARLSIRHSDSRPQQRASNLSLRAAACQAQAADRRPGNAALQTDETKN